MSTNELKNFRDEWFKELNKRLKNSDDEYNSGRSLYPAKDNRPTFEGRDNGEENGDFNESCKQRERHAIHSKKEEKHQTGKDNIEISVNHDADEKPKRVLEKEKNEASCTKIKKARREIDENLLEILIADIDELTSLPFFDLELPKEIAIRIFRYLGVKDLGCCACVNKKWKILADDDLIWFDLCRIQGYMDEDTCAMDRDGWKDIFREKSQSVKLFQQNWKQRICQTSELEYEKGGILYAASVFGNNVVAGYANGLIKLWDIFSESPTASFGALLSETESSRDVSITSVDANSSIIGTSYSNGDVKIWQNGLDFSLIESFNFESSIDSLCVAAKSAAFITSSRNKFRIDAANENGVWRNVFQKTLDHYIRSTHLYDGSDCPSVIHTQNCVELYGKDGCKHQLEMIDNSISAEISAVSCSESMITLGITPLGYSILDGYRIKMFSADDGCLNKFMKGPNCKISCLSMAYMKENLLGVGCFDKKIRIHDMRFENQTMLLKGLTAIPCSLQVDEWKVIAGDEKGFVSVWDQRTQALLWQTGMRHPVRLCQLVGPCLVCVSIPIDRNPKETLWYMDDLIQHRRHRGAIRIYDFSADNNTTGIPEICQSNYDDYAGFNYNINLTTPYDIIDT